MSKRMDMNALRAAVTDPVSTQPTDLSRFEEPAVAPTAPAAPARRAAKAKPAPVSRETGRGVTFFLPQDQFRQLKQICLDDEVSTQDLMQGLVNKLIRSRTKAGAN